MTRFTGARQKNKNADKNVLPRIEAKLKRRLSEGELQRVREADQRKREAMQPVRGPSARGIGRGEVTGAEKLETED